jgi:large subunit ribosomal protein L14
MIKIESILIPKDNTGAEKSKCINIPGGVRPKYASLGNKITVVTQKLKRISLKVEKKRKAKKAKKKIKYKAIITATKYSTRRKDGTHTRFSNNLFVTLNDKEKMQGTRVTSLACKELRMNNLQKAKNARIIAYSVSIV